MSKMKTSLYNQDGSLCSEAQFLLSFKPDNMSIAEWRKRIKEFKSFLSTEDLNKFKRLKAKENNADWRAKNPERRKEIIVNWRTKNPEKLKEHCTNWRTKNPEKTKEITANWKAKNPEKLKQAIANWKAKNREKAKQAIVDWKAKNREKYASYMNNYHKQRRAKDPLYRLQYNTRTMCNRVVRKLSLGKKPTNTFKWLGCNAEELKSHFESLFTEGMSWENYGKWHVDHIRPVSSFKPEEWEQINHYTNLQPLWAEDNYAKSDKW